MIETAEPDVIVRVLKSGQPHRQLTLGKKANSLRLGAGEYEIEIVGEADGLNVQNGHFTLKRGDTWIAKIVLRRANSGLVVTDANARDPVSPDEPTYEGQILTQWLRLLRRERSPLQLHDACKTLDKLNILR